MNRGSLGHNVFLCEFRDDSVSALKSIFDQHSQYYDYVALAQDYVNIKHEYRAIWYRPKADQPRAGKGEVLLVYEKIATDKNENLSPLHNNSGKAVHITDEEIIKKVSGHIAKANLESTFEFLGIDVVIDDKDVMYVLELNTRPGFTYFIRDNGDEKLVEMYEKILIKKFQ